MADRATVHVGSAGSASRRRSYRLWLVAVPLVFVAYAACVESKCEDGTCVDESGMRLFDRICSASLIEGPACEVGGDAELTSAITEDSLGYRLGDGGGTLTVHLEALDAVTHDAGIFDIEVLAASQEDGARPRLSALLSWGSCSGCPSVDEQYPAEVRNDYSWVTVVTNQAPAGQQVPYDAVLTLSGSGIDIADMRTTAVYPNTCSIVGPIGARR